MVEMSAGKGRVFRYIKRSLREAQGRGGGGAVGSDRGGGVLLRMVPGGRVVYYSYGRLYRGGAHEGMAIIGDGDGIIGEFGGLGRCLAYRGDVLWSS